MNFTSGDIVRIKDNNYPGLWEFVETVKKYDGFEFDCIVTNNECDSEMHENSKRLILVCKVENRQDLKEGE